MKEPSKNRSLLGSNNSIILKSQIYKSKTKENRSLVLYDQKRCKKCNTIKPLLDFHKHRYRIGGVCDECKTCTLTRNKERYAKTRFNGERMRGLKNHAAKLNVPFEITSNDLEMLWTKQKGLCYYTNIELEFKKGAKNCVSVDRINPLKGYTLDNICLCCDIVNYMKSDASYKTLLEFCTLIVDNQLPITDQLMQGHVIMMRHKPKNPK